MKISEIVAKAVCSVFGEEEVLAPRESLQFSEDVVREKAYLLWEEAGYPEGDGIEFWIRAEKELGEVS
jgi:hypothetical protein